MHYSARLVERARDLYHRTQVVPPLVFSRQVRISKLPISHLRDHLYWLPLKFKAPPGDDEDNPLRSHVRLFESGRELGPPHAFHKEIASRGGGRFSHWQEGLFFSSSDNTSPNENGRRYTLLVPSRLAMLWQRAGKRIGTGLRETARRYAALVLLGAGTDDTLFFFYDLRDFPLSFDLATSLVVAEIERRKRGLKWVHLVLVPGDWSLAATDGYDKAVPAAARHLRIYQLALPLAQLLESCKGVTLCASLAEAEHIRFALAREVYPPRYEPAAHSSHLIDLASARAPGLAADRFFPMFRANDEARRAVAAFLSDRIGKRRAIVITLRQYGFVEERNSNVANWIAFADELDREKFAAVFVPDTAVALGALDAGLRRHIVSETAAWNIGVRMALYEAAYLNIAHAGGPLELAYYNEACRYAIFMPTNTSIHTSADMLKARGWNVGKDLPFARPWQRIFWEPDALPQIRRAFAEMTAVL